MGVRLPAKAREPEARAASTVAHDELHPLQVTSSGLALAPRVAAESGQSSLVKGRFMHQARRPPDRCQRRHAAIRLRVARVPWLPDRELGVVHLI